MADNSSPDVQAEVAAATDEQGGEGAEASTTAEADTALLPESESESGQASANTTQLDTSTAADSAASEPSRKRRAPGDEDRDNNDTHEEDGAVRLGGMFTYYLAEAGAGGRVRGTGQAFAGGRYFERGFRSVCARLQLLTSFALRFALFVWIVGPQAAPGRRR